jgi:hypothetical protein
MTSDVRYRVETYWCSLDECSSHIAAFVRFGGGLVGEHSFVDSFNVADNGVGGDEAGEGGGAGERDGREEQGGEVGDLHIGCRKEGTLDFDCLTLKDHRDRAAPSTRYMSIAERLTIT